MILFKAEIKDSFSFKAVNKEKAKLCIEIKHRKI